VRQHGNRDGGIERRIVEGQRSAIALPEVDQVTDTGLASEIPSDGEERWARVDADDASIRSHASSDLARHDAAPASDVEDVLARQQSEQIQILGSRVCFVLGAGAQFEPRREVARGRVVEVARFTPLAQ
jgi:hypothetical protein